MTLKVGMVNQSSTIYFPNYLGFVAGDIVRLTLYKLGEPKNVYALTKRLVKIGNSRGCYIDKVCNINKGDLVVVRIQCIQGCSDDTGIQVEEGFEEPFE